jgi:hypothetical protein
MKKVHDKRRELLHNRLMSKWGFDLNESMYNRDDDDDGRAPGEWHQGDKPEDPDEDETPEISPWEHGAAQDDKKVGGKKHPIFEDDREEEEDRHRDAAKDDWDHIVKLAKDAHEDHLDRERGDEDDEEYDRHRDSAEDDWAHIHALAKDAHVDRKEREELEEGDGDDELSESKEKNIIQQMIAEIENTQDHKLNEEQRRDVEASVRKKLKEGYFDRMMAKGKKKWAGVKRVGGMAKKIGAAARGEEYGEEAKDFSSIEFCSMVEKKAKKLQSFFDAMQTDWEKMDFDLRNPKDKKSPAHALRKVQIAAQGLQDFVKLCKAGKIVGLQTGDEVDNECLQQIEQWIRSHPKQDMSKPQAQNYLTKAMEKKGCKVPDDYFEKEGAGGSEGAKPGGK